MLHFNSIDIVLKKRQNGSKLVTKVAGNNPKKTWSDETTLKVGGKKNIRKIIKALNDIGRDDLR